MRRVNPLLQVPTLVLADATVLTESAAILIHLGLEHSRSSLLPGEASARAQALRGLVYIATNCYAPIGIIDYPERWLPGAGDADAQQAALEEGARTRLHENWETFAELFGAPASFRPGAPGAVEILAAVVTRWSGAREHLSSARPAFYTALLQVDTNPTVSAVIKRHWS
ncbi:putative glutathione S-transferase [Pseudomonas syringae pv. cilantro]|uniref:Putative glutathione S-transferase n=1 Tax=Pseudomonas syringae pv. cilantro TaxID=81035 RepID=A0A0N0GGW4_PSESX|nr:putative glutathione S-transferase [Pseudomonas syringae pv. cilantro]